MRKYISLKRLTNDQYTARPEETQPSARTLSLVPRRHAWRVRREGRGAQKSGIDVIGPFQQNDEARLPSKLLEDTDEGIHDAHRLARYANAG
ncbi:hypothetical protein HPP92_017417 [Vanilla planifolia]|uniref:Uncharacterized protein n=1 Tax=Vanilla planifolia TaxID=51239 RepID=A0A835Q529_VANPL|nr:hypothetical protein HPP92_018070 [Vanilla planifolia]KAG0468089.1 hypothetical protein HPP92_017417 [Vanilla planifolia]